MHSPKYLHNVNTALILPLLGSGSIPLLLSSEMTSFKLHVLIYTVFTLNLDFMTLFLVVILSNKCIGKIQIEQKYSIKYYFLTTLVMCVQK